MEIKILLVFQLANSCEAFIKNVDPLAGNLYLLDTGQMTLDQAKGHNTRGMAAKHILQVPITPFGSKRTLRLTLAFGTWKISTGWYQDSKLPPL